MNARRDTFIDRPLEISGRDIDWSKALCRAQDVVADWWHVDHITSAKRYTDAAKERCVKCPIQEPCLEYALVNRIEHGVYGGATAKERKKILKDREGAA